MDRFAPTTSDYGLLGLPLAKAASAVAAFFATGSMPMNRSDLQGSPQRVFEHLEPLSMALDRTLLVANGRNWASYFANGLMGSDAFLPVSRIAEAQGCTGLRIARTPNATIFEAFKIPERGGDIANFYRRTIFASRDGGWKFGSTGEPYSFEDVTRYDAERIQDRFTPDHLDDLLEGLGAPLRPVPEAQSVKAVLFARDGKASQFKVWTYAEVQAGLPWKRA